MFPAGCRYGARAAWALYDSTGPGRLPERGIFRLDDRPRPTPDAETAPIPSTGRAPIHVLRPPALAIHRAACAFGSPPRGGDGGMRVPRGDGTARAARLAARAGLRGGSVPGAGHALPAGGGGHGAARLDRACPRHDRPPHRGARAARAARAALRKGGGARPRPLRARAYRRGHDLDGRRGRAARDLLRRVPVRSSWSPSSPRWSSSCCSPSSTSPSPRLLFGFAMFTLFAPARSSSGGMRGAACAARMPTADSRRSSSTRCRALATLKAFGQSAARGRLLAERAHEVFRSKMWGARDQRALPRPHRHRHRGGERRGARVGAWRVVHGQMGLEGAARHPDDGGSRCSARNATCGALLHTGMDGTRCRGRHLLGAPMPRGRRSSRQRRRSRSTGPLAPGGWSSRTCRSRTPAGGAPRTGSSRSGSKPGSGSGSWGERSEGEIHHRPGCCCGSTDPRRGRRAGRRARLAPAPPRRCLP